MQDKQSPPSQRANGISHHEVKALFDGEVQGWVNIVTLPQLEQGNYQVHCANLTTLLEVEVKDTVLPATG